MSDDLIYQTTLSCQSDIRGGLSLATHHNAIIFYHIILYYIMKEQNGLLTSFRNGAELCQVIIKSEQLKDAIQELTDVTGAVAVSVQLEASDGMLVQIHIESDTVMFCSSVALNSIFMQYL